MDTSASRSEELVKTSVKLSVYSANPATASLPRLLINGVSQVYTEVTMIETGLFIPTLSITPLISILSGSFAAMSNEELTIQLAALKNLIVKS
jgi:hypothetical protein